MIWLFGLWIVVGFLVWLLTPIPAWLGMVLWLVPTGLVVRQVRR